MSQNNSSQFGREDSFDWVNRKLAQALGLGVAASPLRRDRPLDKLSEAEVKNFSNLLKSRLSRVADPKTGQIHYEMVQGSSDFIDDGQDPQLVAIAENYLPILRRAIRSMHGSDCCDDNLTTHLGAADIAIGDLDEELRDAPCKVVIDRILDVLTQQIQEILALSKKNGSPALIQKVNNAQNDFINLQNLINTRTRQFGSILPQNTLDWWNYVATRPMALSHEAAELQRMLSALGVTREQLNDQKIALQIINPNPPQQSRDWTMWEFLQAAQEFPKLWIKEADAKRDPPTARRLANSIRELHDVFNAPLHPNSPPRSKTIEKLCEDLGLLTDECCDDGRMIMARLKRFAKLGVTILAAVAAPTPSKPATPLKTPTPRVTRRRRGGRRP